MGRKIAEERIRRLFQMAEKRARNDKMELSNRYMELARRIGMSYNVSIPSELKRKVCQECKSYLVPGKNVTVRINSKNCTVDYMCEKCGEVNRYGF